MTGIHAIIQKTHADAELRSSELCGRIRKETEDEISAEQAIQEAEIEKRRQALLKQNEHEYGRLRERMSSRLHRDLLSYRHELLNEIFDLAVEKLKNASEKEYADMFAATVKGLRGRFTLYLGEYSVGKLSARDAGKASAENSGLSIKFSHEVVLKKSGFSLRDEKVEYSCLFEDLIKDIKGEQAAALLREVFES